MDSERLMQQQETELDQLDEKLIPQLTFFRYINQLVIVLMFFQHLLIFRYLLEHPKQNINIKIM